MVIQRERFGWYMYDWANSVYPLVINSAIFPIYYGMVTHGSSSNLISVFNVSVHSSSLYSYTIAFSYLLVSLVTPFLSGIADYSGRKKLFLQAFCTIGVVGCVGLYFFREDNLLFGLLCIVLASFGFSGSLVFYNAFLPEIADAADQDVVSARGYSMGYLGSSIVLIVSVLMLYNPLWFGFRVEGWDDAQVFLHVAPTTFLLVAAWWLGWSQITFRFLKDRKSSRRTANILLSGLRELKQVWQELHSQKLLRLYLIAFFVTSMGVQTVILVSALFGSQVIGMKSSEQVLLILLLQFVAIGGSYAFSWLSQRLGNIPSLLISLVVWIIVCVSALFIHTVPAFEVLALIVGFVLGGTQSLSRSTYSKLLPATHDHASYFSFFDICEKVGIVLGMVCFGWLIDISGDMNASIAAVAAFFVCGLIILQILRRRRA